MEITEDQISVLELEDSNNTEEISLDQALVQGFKDSDQSAWEIKRRSRIQGSILSGKANYPKSVKFFWGDDKKPEELNGNRCLLASSSLEFARFLSHRIHDNIIEINHVNPRDLWTMLEYLMGEFTWKFSTIAETCSLIEASAKFGLPGLNDEIFQLLTLRSQNGEEHLDDENACRAWCLFKKLDPNNYLAISAKEYILRNGENIFGEDYFLNLPLKDFEELLKDDGLTINCELDVFKAVLRWGINNLKRGSMKCTANALGAAIATLIPLVRLSSITKTEFKHYVMPWNFLGPQQLEWIQHFWESEPDLIGASLFNTKPRNYIGKIDDEDLPLKIQSTQAELFYEKNVNDFDRHNLNLEMQTLKATLAQQQSILAQLQQQLNSIPHRIPETVQHPNFETNPAYKELETLRNELTKRRIEADWLLLKNDDKQAEIVRLNRDLANQLAESRKLQQAQEHQSQTMLCIWNEFFLTKMALKCSVNAQQTREKRLWFPNDKYEKEAAQFTKKAMEFLVDEKSEEATGVFLLHNNTPLELHSPAKCFFNTTSREHVKMPLAIHVHGMEGFVFKDKGKSMSALFSYNIGDLCFVAGCHISGVANGLCNWDLFPPTHL